MSIRPFSAVPAVKCLALVALAGAWSAPAIGAGPGANVGQRDQLSVRQRDRNTAKALRKEAQAKQCGPETSFALGAAYGHSQGGDHSVNTPFLFDYALCDLDLQFGGDGYTRSVSDGERSSGLADVFGGISYKFSSRDKKWALVPSFQLTLPTRGKVGSRRASEFFGLDLKYSPGEYGFSWTAAGGVNRDGESSEDVSRYTSGVSGTMTYAVDDYRWASLALARDYQRGKGGSTTLTVVGNYPISPTVDVSLSVARGLTSGKRDSSVELDFTFSF